MSSQLKLTWGSIQRRSRWGLSRSKNVSSKFLKRPCKERYMVNNGRRQNFLLVSGEVANWCTTWLDQQEAIRNDEAKSRREVPVEDTDLRIRGWGVGSLQKISFRPFGPQFGLKIRGGGGLSWIRHKGRLQSILFTLSSHKQNQVTLKSTNRCTLNLSLPFLSSKDRNAMNFDMNSSWLKAS